MKVSEIDESIVQYISMWKVLAGDRPGADLTDRNGLSVCWADSPFPFWNALFVPDPISSAEVLMQRLEASATYMRSKKHGGLLYLCEDYLSETAVSCLDAAVKEAGLDFALDIFGMAGEMLPYSPPAPRSSLEFVRVTDEAALQQYGEINAQGYGFPDESGRAGLAGSTFWKTTAYSFIGYERGEAVSTASAIVNQGQLYLALVATRPHAQRKGYGEATVRHALQAAHEATGLTRTSLHATHAGMPVYQRAGYHRTTRFLTYRLAP